MIRHKQKKEHAWFVLPEESFERFWRNIGHFEPLSVETQAEFDWLFAMQLMIGREMIILLNEQDNPTDLPVTHLKIDITL